MSPAPDKSDLQWLTDRLRAGCRGVLAPASGGCVQYLLSADVDVHLTPTGRLQVRAPDRSASQQALLAQTTLSLRIPLRVDADGTERELLILAGHLQPGAGDDTGPFVFVASRSHVMDISGAIYSMPVERLGLTR
jgi:hypothetical protein